MNSRWYAVPGYKGKSQHGEIRDPHVLDASGQLVCVCEGLDIAERIAEDHNQDERATDYLRDSIEHYRASVENALQELEERRQL